LLCDKNYTIKNVLKVVSDQWSVISFNTEARRTRRLKKKKEIWVDSLFLFFLLS
jgi:hypothetical protein